jgi:GNAT superfamily N-acetyltransferase
LAKRQWDVRPFDAAKHRSAVLRLWSGVSGFDASIPVRSEEELDAVLAHESADGGAAWRVAVAGNDAVVGIMDLRFVGTKRTRVRVAVNPAWRHQGVATSLFKQLPEGKRLLAVSRGSLDAATSFFEKHGFAERHRDTRLRRGRQKFEPLELPSWAELEEDDERDPERFIRVAADAFGEAEESDPALVAAHLGRPGVRLLYLKTPQGDQGMCMVSALDCAKKSERNKAGESRIGLLERVGLAKACRGKGLSRPLVRAGLGLLWDGGYEEFEVVSDGRRPQGQRLYESDGFEPVDEAIHWIRRDDEADD